MRKCIGYLTWAKCSSKWQLPLFPLDLCKGSVKIIFISNISKGNKGPDWLASVKAEYLCWPKAWTSQVQPCLAFLSVKSFLQIFPGWLFLLNLLSGQMSPPWRGFP